MGEVVKIMGIPMHPWTIDKTVDNIAHRLENGTFTQHVVVNVAKIVRMCKDLHLREAVLTSDIINIDGMGVVWGARFLGLDIPERVAGIDLFTKLLEFASEQNKSVFFLGSRDGVIEQTVKNIHKRYPYLKIAGWHHGYFWDDEEAMVDTIRSAKADLLFVAITSPKKEQFISQWRERLGVKFVMGVGGTFDVMAGVTKRAPEWMQNLGLEWFYRLIQEPDRMWKRYLIGNTTFIYYVLREKFICLRGQVLKY